MFTSHGFQKPWRGLGRWYVVYKPEGLLHVFRNIDIANVWFNYCCRFLEEFCVYCFFARRLLSPPKPFSFLHEFTHTLLVSARLSCAICIIRRPAALRVPVSAQFRTSIIQQWCSRGKRHKVWRSTGATTSLPAIVSTSLSSFRGQVGGKHPLWRRHQALTVISPWITVRCPFCSQEILYTVTSWQPVLEKRTL